jgi:hypothetical protein
LDYKKYVCLFNFLTQAFWLAQQEVQDHRRKRRREARERKRREAEERTAFMDSGPRMLETKEIPEVCDRSFIIKLCILIALLELTVER